MNGTSNKTYKHKKHVYVCGHGVGNISGIKKIKLSGIEAEEFYQIAFENDKMEVNVPISSPSASGLRNLISYEDATLLFSSLKRAVPKKMLRGPWHKRIKIIRRLFCSSNPLDVTQLIKELTLMERSLKISYDEKIYLKRARSLIASEVANVIGESKEKVEQKMMENLSLLS